MSIVMAKTETVRARINPATKAMADKVLEAYGLTHSAFINLSYHSLINGGGVPLSRNVPNSETISAIQEPRSAGRSFNSAEEMIADLDQDD